MGKAKELADFGGVVTVDSSGNVGINNASPASKLDIVTSTSYGGAKITGANGGSLNLYQPQSNASAKNWQILTNWEAWGTLDIQRSTTNADAPSSTVLSLTGAGVVSLPNGQLKFPATQSSSSDANTLDDYEEGTWTPSYTLSAGSVSGVTSSGNYIKIGRQVTVNFYITFTTATGASINTITGLPFTVANTTAYSIGTVRENANTGYMWQLRPSANDTVLLIRLYNNADQISSGYSFYGSATYFATN